MKNAFQNAIINTLKGGDCMAEKKESGKKQYNTLRAYLVYDYIFKKVEGTWFTTTRINEYLKLFGVECDNRSIVRDIEAINRAYIMLREELDSVEEADELLLEKENQLVYREENLRNTYRVNKNNYHHKDFDMIIECIGAARFISDSETQHLIDALSNHLHSNDLEKIKSDVSKIQREKVDSKCFHSNLKEIQGILYPREWFGYKSECCKKITFYYLTYSIDRIGNSLEKQEREYCIAYPHRIVNKNGLYYLVAYDETKRKMRMFRIDRMIELHCEYDEKRSGIRLADKMDFSTLTNRTFDMCFGESTRVTIRCKNSIFDVMYERFGTDGVSYHKCDDNHFEVSVILEVSPKFFGWLCGFGKDAKLISPPAVVDEFYNYVDEIKRQYNSK